MNRVEKIQRDSIDKIYLVLFGKAFKALLLLAHKRPDFNILQSDDMHEALMDCMSIEALEAVGFVQKIVGKTLLRLPYGALNACSDEQITNLIAHAINEAAAHYMKKQGYRKGQFVPFWYEDSKRNSK